MPNVRLEFTDEQNISCNPSTVHVRKQQGQGENVVWRFEQLDGSDVPFTLYFDGLTPFDHAHIEGSTGLAQSGVAKRAQLGVYKYIVAAYNHNTNKVVIACPCCCCEC